MSNGARINCLFLLMLSTSVMADDKDVYTMFKDSHLADGRAIWMENCEGCHGYGIAGSPVPMTPEDWRERLNREQSTLYRHAIEGYFGPDDSMMPPRGGNENLTDDEVRAAVDYMTTLAKFYIQKLERKQ